MPKTGVGLLQILSLVAILLPLVPVFIIFISKTYKEDVLALLMALCLVTFVGNVILYTPRFVQVENISINAIFQLINYTVLFILLQAVIEQKWLRELSKFLLVAFVSAVITIYSIRAIPTYLPQVEFVQALLLILLNLIVLFQLIRSQDIYIFLSPTFWIAGGSFFYYSMFLLTQSIPEYKGVSSETPQKKILLLVIILVQFIFYIVGAAVAANKSKEDRMISY